jgi:hypothetical protein
MGNIQELEKQLAELKKRERASNLDRKPHLQGKAYGVTVRKKTDQRTSAVFYEKFWVTGP